MALPRHLVRSRSEVGYLRGLRTSVTTRPVAFTAHRSPASNGWVTLHLPTGRYELLCNLPGHYTVGMYAELDVT